jgi:hypothetical protein
MAVFSHFHASGCRKVLHFGGLDGELHGHEVTQARGIRRRGSMHYIHNVYAVSELPDAGQH